MSALMNRLHTDDIAKIFWHGEQYAVPVKIIEHYKVEKSTDSISVDDLFADLVQQSGESGVLLKGLRYREGLTQLELAKKLKITQANLSAMENGRRSIGKELAKRIAELFGLNYRVFL